MAPPPPHLPIECLLYVFLNLDPVSTVRCAAVSRHWRRAVIENAPEIRRHPRCEADRHLLLGFFYRELYPGEFGFSHRSSWSPSVGQHWSDSLLGRPLHYLPAAEGMKTKLYAPLACTDGLLLVCRGVVPQMCVCNPLTGFHTSIPHPSKLINARRYYLLHSCHGGVEMTSPSPNSFQVLAADINRDGMLILQNYCSESGRWGPVFRPNIDTLLKPRICEFRAGPVVCRGVVHWLRREFSEDLDLAYQYPLGRTSHIIAVDPSTGQARMIRLPMQFSMRDDMLMLATSEGDRLSLLRPGETNMEVSI